MRRRGTRVVAYVQGSVLKQIKLLEGTLNLSRSAVISEAVARWFHNEPMIGRRLPKKRREVNAVEKAEGQ